MSKNKRAGGAVKLSVAKQPSPRIERRDTMVAKLVPKSVSRTRKDISDWQGALRMADRVDNPRRAKLVRLYDDILLDAHLASQVEIRFQQTLAAPFSIYRGDKEDEGLTEALAGMPWVDDLNTEILYSRLYGHSLVELSAEDGGLHVELIPRTHVVPETGLILIDEGDSNGVAYRDTKEYRAWILEFGRRKDYGLLNKAVPHVLFKKFAQACWSELCEIYGIPPRYLKTNTQDPAMMARAESAMRDIGSAAWFILDETEEFKFAENSASTNGDVYKNLISLCNNEMSTLISGAVIGQDTVNGNRSKEEVGVSLQDKLVQADRKYLAMAWNDMVLPALARIGIVPEGCRYRPQPEEDTAKLLNQTVQILPYMKVDPDWVREKFGIQVTEPRETGAVLSAGGNNDFFD